MKPILALEFCAFWLILAASMNAAAEDLRCYKIKDPQEKAKYVADVRGITAETGCVIKVPAVMACVPGTKTNLTPTPPGSASVETSKGLACYQTACPKKKKQKAPSNVRLDDQFGDRSVVPGAAKLLCVPVDTPIFSCGDGPYPQCGGTCPDEQVCVGFEFGSGGGLPPVCDIRRSCQCVNPASACQGQPCPSRLCKDLFCGILSDHRCVDCGRPGASCVSSNDCCFGACFVRPGGSSGICLDLLRDRGSPTP